MLIFDDFTILDFNNELDHKSWTFIQ